MSSYIVDDSTINRITSYLNRWAHSDKMHRGAYALQELGYCLDDSNELERLGADMFRLNVAATSQRYHGESIETLPGTVGHYEYTHHWENCDAATVLEELSRFIYQCAEGNVPESPLYQALDQDVRLAFMGRRIEELEASDREPLPSIWTR